MGVWPRLKYVKELRINLVEYGVRGIVRVVKRWLHFLQK